MAKRTLNWIIHFSSLLKYSQYGRYFLDLTGYHYTLFVCLFVCLFKATLSANRISQARDQIRAMASSLCHSHSNARSLTHLVRPGIEPTSSWILVRFISTAPQQELCRYWFLYLFIILFYFGGLYYMKCCILY